MPAELRGSVYTTSRGSAFAGSSTVGRRYRSGSARSGRSPVVHRRGTPSSERRKREPRLDARRVLGHLAPGARRERGPGTVTTLRYPLAHALDEFGCRWPICNARHSKSPHGVHRCPRASLPRASAFRQALAAAVAWDLIEVNAVKKPGRTRTEGARDSAATAGEIAAVYVEIGEHRNLVTFAVETGHVLASGSPSSAETSTRRESCLRRARARRGRDEALRRDDASRRAVRSRRRPLRPWIRSPESTRRSCSRRAGGYMNLRNWRRRDWDTLSKSLGSQGHALRPAAYVRVQCARRRSRHVRARPVHGHVRGDDGGTTAVSSMEATKCSARGSRRLAGRVASKWRRLGSWKLERQLDLVSRT